MLYHIIYIIQATRVAYVSAARERVDRCRVQVQWRVHGTAEELWALVTVMLGFTIILL